MDYPRLTEDQLRLNNEQFNNLIKNVRALSPAVADLLMMNRNPIDRHIRTLESEAEIIKQFDSAIMRKLDRRTKHGQETCRSTSIQTD